MDTTDPAHSAAAAKMHADANLAAAEADAAALLAELQGQSVGQNPKYKMPSPYAPGEGPRDPRDSVARPEGYDQLSQALTGEGNWSTSFNDSTLPAPGLGIPSDSGHIDFAKKVKDARNPYGSH